LGHRLRITAEVTVSKLFPAGFCWQYGSIVAENAFGFTADSVGFALTTGAFDAVGVALGHTVFYTLAKKVYLPDLDLQEVRQTGALLGSAAFFSGTAWQPTVNCLSSLSFTPAALCTMGACTAAFFAGLRVFRTIYPSLGMDFVARGSADNFGKDLQLSVAIGGAGAAFVGTDVSFASNWLRPLVGVEDNMSDIVGMVRAGSSTALGFAAVQMVQNVAWPTGKNWAD